IEMPDVVFRIEPLELAFERDHRLQIEQLSQLRITDELAQLRLIDDQRLRASLGQRRIAVVDETRDVVEEQRRRKWRRFLRINRHALHLTAANIRKRADKRGDIEEIAEAFAIRLEQYRK